MPRKTGDYADMLEQRFAFLAPHLLPYYREYYPFDNTKHRCDFAWPDHGLIVEIDGGQFMFGGGSHASATDYSKINRLVLAGWRVLRYNTKLLGDVSHIVTPTMADDTLWIIQQIEAALAMPPQSLLEIPQKGVRSLTRRISHRGS